MTSVSDYRIIFLKSEWHVIQRIGGGGGGGEGGGGGGGGSGRGGGGNSVDGRAPIS